MTHQARQDELSAAMWRFALLGKLTLLGTGAILPWIMTHMTYLSLGHQIAVAFEIAGIAVMSSALLIGSLGQVRQWWRQLDNPAENGVMQTVNA